MVGLITNNGETAYREDVRALGVWCQENNLTLNVNKTKEGLPGGAVVKGHQSPWVRAQALS